MPSKYVPFIPEPVERQAVLGRFNRTLRYKGADEISINLQWGMSLYEMEAQENMGNNTGDNMVIVLDKIMQYNQKVMLNSKKAFKPIEIVRAVWN